MRRGSYLGGKGWTWRVVRKGREGLERGNFHYYVVCLFKLYAFILLTSTLVPGINYFVVTTHPLHQLQVRKFVFVRNTRIAIFIHIP